MVNFGYPYNDIVICKDSTDYLFKYDNIQTYDSNIYIKISVDSQ